MAAKGISRRERQKQQHRQDIIQAALELFSENGYAAVSMQQIAERAEFATGTLYNFFESKEQLFSDLVSEYVQHAHEVLLKALDDSDILKALNNFAIAKGEIFKEHFSFARIYLAEVRGLGFTPVRDELVSALNDILKALTQVFQKGIDQGLFKPVDPALLALQLNGMTSVLLLETAFSPEDMQYGKRIQEVMDLFLNGCTIPDTTKE